MKRRRYLNFLIPLISIVITLIALEGAVRVIETTDQDGNSYFLWRHLKPYRLPAVRASEAINTYLESRADYLVDDPDLGWAIAPNGEGGEGLYASNAAGIRSNVDYPLSPQPGTIRIALFGDSFTHGDEVPYQDTWGYQLQELLREQGIDAEVLNFGVPGYGMDQAYLRWQILGQEYAPDIVLFGFQPEDVGRNVNLFRMLLYPETGIPLSKPRYILEDGSLTLVNYPTIPLAEIPDTIASFPDSPLAAYETFYHEDDYSETWWQRSRLLAVAQYVIETKITDTHHLKMLDLYALDGDPAQLTFAIIQAFEKDVEAHGAQFVIVHLPAKGDLQRISDGRPLEYGDLFAYLDENHRVVHTEEGLSTYSENDLFEGLGHYSTLGNRVVAAAVANELPQWEARAGSTQGGGIASISGD
jgi:hypothetical protein